MDIDRKEEQMTLKAHGQSHPESEPLSVEEVVDVADTAPRAPAPDTSGVRVEAIPYQNCTTVVIRKVDFALGGIDHPDVEWDFRIDNFTVKVGDGISQEAADFLVNGYPEQFKYLGK